jgi:hypothetical protein
MIIVPSNAHFALLTNSMGIQMARHGGHATPDMPYGVHHKLILKIELI